MVDRTSPFAAPVAASRAGITLSAPDRCSLWQIAAWPDTFDAVEAALTKACGCAAAAPGRVTLTNDNRLLVRVEPLKWWVIGPDGAGCPFSPAPEEGAWIDLSHDQATLRLEGEDAAELLKRIVSIDLRAATFPDLSFATTQAHHMITRILRRDSTVPGYDVMVMRSYADDLHEILDHHLAAFG